MPLIRLLRSRPGIGLALAGLLICAGCSASEPNPGPTSNPATTAPTSPTAPDPSDSSGTSIGPVSPIRAPTAAGEACVQTAFSELTAAQQAGQLVMTGVPVGDPAKYRALVTKKHLGSVFLAGRTSHSPSTIKKGVAKLAAEKTKTTTIKPAISVDQEGGKVQSLRGGAWTTIPSAKTQGTWSTSRLTARTKAWVKQLNQAGITMDLAPVADTVPAGTEKQNPPIGFFDRQYGNTPTEVSESIATMTSTMQAGRVIATVKHFPGLGRVRFNTDTSTKAVDTQTTVTSAYLKPFQAGIDAGAGAVMISSASYPKIDKDNVAVFSSAVITDLLRGRMKYQDVVMTDDVGRAVAVKSVPIGRRATRFIDAGGDLVLTVMPENATAMVDAIAGAARSYPSFRAKVKQSVLRVLRLKQKSGLLTCA